MNEYKEVNLTELAMQYLLEEGDKIYSSWYSKISECPGKSKLKRFFTWMFSMWSHQVEKTHGGYYIGSAKSNGIRFFGHNSETYERFDNE